MDVLRFIVSLGTVEVCIGVLLLLRPNLFVRPAKASDEPALWLWRPPAPDPTLRHARDAVRVCGFFVVLSVLFDVLCH